VVAALYFFLALVLTDVSGLSEASKMGADYMGAADYNSRVGLASRDVLVPAILRASVNAPPIAKVMLAVSTAARAGFTAVGASPVVVALTSWTVCSECVRGQIAFMFLLFLATTIAKMRLGRRVTKARQAGPAKGDTSPCSHSTKSE
jgi:hypothetical protein